MLTEVVVLHEPTIKIGKVNQILPRRSFVLRLPEQPMFGKKATIAWRDHLGRNHLVQGKLPYDPQAAKNRRIMRLIYEIQPGGKVALRLD